MEKQLTPRQLLEARDWIKDCCPWRDLPDPECVDDLSDEEVVKGVEKHFSGGLRQFAIETEGLE
ncbi:peptide ABC transporter substrate-binding protein [Nostoc sp. 2RC]|uniref:peptide ABC transporter substrate-binding protein n=1 Tax=Nostoc sp. 2RC TaxID=2485484 RepID=UPI0016234FA2|nr:peptide ABC transporter substrate-binding protein [Nostoc sp. 2RC]MBC1235658.1 peptide ABC transporter substrate-binding protein [Nostoc sp. 2RC]